jgi:hypothetical protein
VARLEGQWELETSAGDVWELTGITRMTGHGLPPATFAAQQTPTIHGSSHLGFRIENREIVIGIALGPAYASLSNCAETARRRGPYPTLNLLAGPLTLRRTDRWQGVLELRNCWYAGGMEGDSENLFENKEFFATLLICRDPVFYDTEARSLSMVYANFDHGPDYSTVTLEPHTYGDWYAFPTLAILGPCTSFNLQSITTGQRLRFTKEIAGGEIVTIETNPHVVTATSNLAGDVELYIPPSDDFGGFRLDPNPLVAEGVNEWTLSVSGIDANSLFTFAWEDRYQGT